MSANNKSIQKQCADHREILHAGDEAETPQLRREPWIDVGACNQLAQKTVQQVFVGDTKIALTCKDGEFGAISGVCNHFGGPLAEGTLAGDYVVCPWHSWMYHRSTGRGEPGNEHDCVATYEVCVLDGRVLIRSEP